jgi:hypothetical protein
MTKTESQFVVCVKNTGYPAALELRKLYQVVADADATRHHRVRVIDESGEDYLYPEEYFASVQLPQAAEKAVLRCKPRLGKVTSRFLLRSQDKGDTRPAQFTSLVVASDVVGPRSEFVLWETLPKP